MLPGLKQGLPMYRTRGTVSQQDLSTLCNRHGMPFTGCVEGAIYRTIEAQIMDC
jgi:hypothetical protein